MLLGIVTLILTKGDPCFALKFFVTNGSGFKLEVDLGRRDTGSCEKVTLSDDAGEQRWLFDSGDSLTWDCYFKLDWGEDIYGRKRYPIDLKIICNGPDDVYLSLYIPSNPTIGTTARTFQYTTTLSSFISMLRSKGEWVDFGAYTKLLNIRWIAIKNWIMSQG